MRLLANRNWRDIRLVANTHSLYFNSNQTYQQGYEMVSHALLKEGVLQKSYRRLSSVEREPLIALMLADGTMALHLFTAQFGEIRPYKPWREDCHRYPWKRPISIAEKLWHLGMIEITHKPDQVHLPHEVQALLPPPPRPKVVACHHLDHLSGQTNLVRDIASLLAGYVANDHQHYRGRWLAPRSLRLFNRRLIIAENIDKIRTERQTQRLRFLNYLLQVSGLIIDGVPTPQAWEWLAKPQLHHLWKAITTDLQSHAPLWDDYQLPSVNAKAWSTIVKVLSSLKPDTAYDAHSIYVMLRFQIKHQTFDKLLKTVFTWSGWLHIEKNTIKITAPIAMQQPAHISLHHDHIYINLPSLPYLQPFVTISSWADVVSSSCLKVGTKQIHRAIENGYTSASIISDLATLIGAPLSSEMMETIQFWEQMATSLTMKPVILLTVKDAKTLTQLRSDWRLRPLLGQSLSPHHITIPADQVETLQRRLTRRGYPITKHITHVSNKKSYIHEEYLYLACRLYREISQMLQPDVHLPLEVIKRIQSTISDERQVILDEHIKQIRQSIVPSETIRSSGRGGVIQSNQETITQAVEQAYQQREALTIRYYSPYTGETTTRTIEPIMIYERNGARYIEAWCQLDDDNRTFRIDRILEIIQSSHN